MTKKPQVSAGTRLGVVYYNTWIQLNCNIVLNRPQTILYKSDAIECGS